MNACKFDMWWGPVSGRIYCGGLVVSFGGGTFSTCSVTAESSNHYHCYWQVIMLRVISEFKENETAC